MSERPIEEVIGWHGPYAYYPDNTEIYWDANPSWPEGAPQARSHAEVDDLAAWLVARGIAPDVVSTWHDVSTYAAPHGAHFVTYSVPSVHRRNHGLIFEALAAAVRRVAGEVAS